MDAGSADSGVADTAPQDALPTVPATPPPPPSEPGRHAVTLLETRRVIPGDGLPAETTALVSNNNLDVVRHEGRVYLAWRTAPDHFASSRTVLYVVSSTDERSWRFEQRLEAATDLREPRFLALGSALYLYVSRLGRDPLRFEPQGVSVTERGPDGRWSALEPVGDPGLILWRSRAVGPVGYLTVYRGGEHIYLFDGMPLEVEFLTTRDGRRWDPVEPARRVVYRGGASETDFAFREDGSLVTVLRNEAGDDSGWGSLVCTATAAAPAQWRCRNDPRKFDSPWMFHHDGEVYLLARRNVTETGHYDLLRRDHDRLRQTLDNQLAYTNAPKRCALWRYDATRDTMVFILDLPSRGDTCFPSVLSTERPGEFVVYNYSSAIDGPDVAWNVGQQGPTFIYRHVLRFSPR